jgi:hypothetical protein
MWQMALLQRRRSSRHHRTAVSHVMVTCNRVGSRETTTTPKRTEAREQVESREPMGVGPRIGFWRFAQSRMLHT